MKKIGLIGGTSPESTLLYYDYLVKFSRNYLERHVYPEIVIYSVNFKDVMNLVGAGKFADLARKFSEIFNWMRGIGVEVGALTANTMHLVFNMIETDLELVHIVDAVALEALRKNYKKLVLFGTRATMESSLYPNVASKHGLEIVVPSGEDRGRINEIIFDELVLGKVRDETKEELKKMAEKYLEDADALILGCTELPLALKGVGLPVLDSTEIHAREIFRRAVGI